MYFAGGEWPMGGHGVAPKRDPSPPEPLGRKDEVQYQRGLRRQYCGHNKGAQKMNCKVPWPPSPHPKCPRQEQDEQDNPDGDAENLAPFSHAILPGNAILSHPFVTGSAQVQEENPTSPLESWRPRRDLNPRYRRERADNGFPRQAKDAANPCIDKRRIEKLRYVPRF